MTDSAQHQAETAQTCDVPNCGQAAVDLVANDAPLMSPEYAERYVCRWHKQNPSGGNPDSWQWLGMSR